MPVVHRRLDWRTRLRAFANEHIGQSFQWGLTDCGTLARLALLTMFPMEIESRLPVQWDSIFGAQSALSNIGSFDAFLRGLGATVSQSPNFVRAGDIVIETEKSETVGQVAIMVCLDGQECLGVGHETGVFVTRIPKDVHIYSIWEIAV